MKQAIVLGGILLGDTFRLSEWIVKVAGDDGVAAISAPYNHGVVDIFTHDTDLQIMKNVLLPKFQMEGLSWVDFENFCEILKRSELHNRFDSFLYPSIEDLHHPLTPITYWRPFFDIELPDEFIVCQPFTHMMEKNVVAITKVHYPLPVVNIGGLGDQIHILGSQIENGRPLREVASIISKAKLVVGIDSWAKQFATQIGVPSICAHWGKWEFHNRGVRELGGIDLLCPNARKIQDTISDALTLIESKNRDLLPRLSDQDAPD